MDLQPIGGRAGSTYDRPHTDPMNTATPVTKPVSDAESTARGITIIYEDRMAGLRAKRFSDMLIVSLGWQPNTIPACWRGELLELPRVAEESARDAVESEFII